MTRRLICCLLLSVTLHLLLWLPGFAPPSAPVATSASGLGGGRVEVRLRLLDASAKSAEASVVASKAQPATPIDTGHSDVDKSAAAPSLEVAPASSLFPILPASLPRDFDRDAYLPGDQLDSRPQPEQPIVISLDDPEVLGRDKGQVVLVVFVGADGSVDQVDVDSTEVPVAITSQVADLFRQARMVPGQQGGQPVKARMKILVEFEAIELLR